MTEMAWSSLRRTGCLYRQTPEQMYPEMGEKMNRGIPLDWDIAPAALIHDMVLSISSDDIEEDGELDRLLLRVAAYRFEPHFSLAEVDCDFGIDADRISDMESAYGRDMELFLATMPPLVIGRRHRKLEILDGAHRHHYLLKHGVKTAPAWVAMTKSELAKAGGFNT